MSLTEALARLEAEKHIHDAARESLKLVESRYRAAMRRIAELEVELARAKGE